MYAAVCGSLLVHDVMHVMYTNIVLSDHKILFYTRPLANLRKIEGAGAFCKTSCFLDRLRNGSCQKCHAQAISSDSSAYTILYGTVSAKIAPRLKCYRNASRLNRYNFPTNNRITLSTS